MALSFAVDLEKISKAANYSIPVITAASFAAGHFVSFYFHFATVPLLMLLGLNLYYLRVQKTHALLANYGILAQMRYVFESLGPELRQYLFMSDTEERPFNRVERAEVYRKAKGIDSASSFGSQLAFDGGEFKLLHSMFPVPREDLEPFRLTLGEERGIDNAFTMDKPFMISAMSYGSLGQNAVRALARGAKRAGIAMNTGEGGYPKYHLLESPNLIFQMGTAKFGVRTRDGGLDDDKLAALAAEDAIKMVEIKLSQGAKPGKGGLLPKEKITAEIAELRGVPMGEDVVSPPSHLECRDVASTVAFIRRVQEVSALPVGIKLCLGRDRELVALIREMKTQDVFPDYISIDGAEGGTGAAPKAFMDDFGVPLLEALPVVDARLREEGVRDRLKVFAAGKLISPGKQILALSLGADAVYSARGFMLALGCIQALQCNQNTCPVGITTHHPHLQRGLDIELKARRVENYVHALEHDWEEALSALGKRTLRDLSPENVLMPGRLQGDIDLTRDDEERRRLHIVRGGEA
ncbi:MAG: FMN-binding glutamate synthase family protein [Myxococcales bacterium]|nr:FMN-binding glutamate synthase family protein [Myxococcales bacterium]